MEEDIMGSKTRGSGSVELQEVEESFSDELTSDGNSDKESCAVETSVSKNKPKRGLTAYNIFFQYERERLISGNTNNILELSERQKIANIVYARAKSPRKSPRKHRKTHGKVSFRELAKTIGERWKALDSETRQIFEEFANSDQLRYKEEILEWRNKNQNQKPKLKQRSNVHQNKRFQKKKEHKTAHGAPAQTNVVSESLSEAAANLTFFDSSFQSFACNNRNNCYDPSSKGNINAKKVQDCHFASKKYSQDQIQCQQRSRALVEKKCPKEPNQNFQKYSANNICQTRGIGAINNNEPPLDEDKIISILNKFDKSNADDSSHSSPTTTTTTNKEDNNYSFFSSRQPALDEFAQFMEDFERE